MIEKRLNQPEKTASADSASHPVLRISIRVHWSLAVLMVFVNVLIVAMVIGMLLEFSNTNGLDSEQAGLVVGMAFCMLALAVANALVVPMFFSHYIQLDDHRLSIVLGIHRASIDCIGILSVSEKIPASAGYVWKPTAPGPVRIHGRLFDEVVAVADKELLYEELLKRNPRIRIVRKGES